VSHHSQDSPPRTFKIAEHPLIVMLYLLGYEQFNFKKRSDFYFNIFFFIVGLLFKVAAPSAPYDVSVPTIVTAW